MVVLGIYVCGLAIGKLWSQTEWVEESAEIREVGNRVVEVWQVKCGKPDDLFQDWQWEPKIKSQGWYKIETLDYER